MGVGGSAPRPGHLYPWENPVPIPQEAGWVPGPVLMGRKSCPNRIRSQTIQPVVSHYTDWATRPTVIFVNIHIFPQGSRLYHPTYICGIPRTWVWQLPIPVAVPSTSWVCGHSLGLWVWILPVAWMSASCKCSVLHRYRSLHWANPSSTEFYQMCVCVSPSATVTSTPTMSGRKRSD